MRISNEILQDYKDAYRVSISMKSELDKISEKLYGENHSFHLLYPSEKRVVVATHMKSIQQCISAR
tara:strand:+ start:1088 stop:1285 length:198 start_codon:yes stop_codon:yes gene_type:complete